MISGITQRLYLRRLAYTFLRMILTPFGDYLFISLTLLVVTPGAEGLQVLLIKEVAADRIWHDMIHTGSSYYSALPVALCTEWVHSAVRPGEPRPPVRVVRIRGALALVCAGRPGLSIL